MKKTNRACHAKRRGVSERVGVVIGAALLGAILLTSASLALAQYGVRSTAILNGPNRTVAVRRTTVGGGLPHGYVAMLPAGYRTVVVSGVRYYTIGGVYYRPQMYASRIVYVRVHI